MKLVLITRHNMLLPIATVGSDGLFMYCVCLHCYMPPAQTEAFSITASLLIMHNPLLLCTQLIPPAFVCIFLTVNVRSLQYLHHLICIILGVAETA